MVVLDASIVLKWLLPGEEHAEASRYREAHVSGEEHMVVPSLLFYEVANVLRYKEELSNDDIVELYAVLDGLELTTMQPAFSEVQEAVVCARAKKISVYDASYVMLARRIGAALITADARLAKSVQENFVKLLDA